MASYISVSRSCWLNMVKNKGSLDYTHRAYGIVRKARWWAHLSTSHHIKPEPLGEGLMYLIYLIYLSLLGCHWRILCICLSPLSAHGGFNVYIWVPRVPMEDSMYIFESPGCPWRIPCIYLSPLGAHGGFHVYIWVPWVPMEHAIRNA